MQDTDGSKKCAVINSSTIGIGTFTGSIDAPTRFSIDNYVSDTGLRDGSAYTGTVAVDGKTFSIAGGIIKSVR